MVHYLFNAGDASKPNDIIEAVVSKISPEQGEIAMTFASRLEKRGELRKQEDIAFKLFAKGMTLDFIAEVTELPTERLLQLQNSEHPQAG